MPTSTVVALLDLDDQPPDMLVAGVIEGEHDMADSDTNTGQFAQFQRHATSVEAANAQEAEQIARDQNTDHHQEEH